MYNKEEIWEKIDTQYGLRYIPIIDNISKRLPEFLKFFHDLGINNIRVLSICDPQEIINLVLQNNDYSKILEKSWIYYLQGYDLDFRSIDSDIDYILTIQNKREKYRDKNKKDLELLLDTGDLNEDELEDILEFRKLEHNQLEEFLNDERRELESLRKQIEVLKDQNIEEKIKKIILFIINKTKYLVKHPQSSILFYF